MLSRLHSNCTRPLIRRSLTSKRPAPKASNFITKNADSIGLFGFLLITVQWSLTDILSLRCCGVVVSTTMIAYNYCRPVPMMLPVGFNAIFVGINAWKIMEIWEERRDMKVEGELGLLYDRTFRGFLTKRAFLNLVGLGEVEEFAGDSRIVERGGAKNEIMVIIEGEAKVIDDSGSMLASLGPGDWIGELAFIEGKPRKATVDVDAGGRVRVVRWTGEIFGDHLANLVEVKHALEAMWSRAL